MLFKEDGLGGRNTISSCLFLVWVREYIPLCVINVFTGIERGSAEEYNLCVCSILFGLLFYLWVNLFDDSFRQFLKTIVKLRKFGETFSIFFMPIKCVSGMRNKPLADE